MLYFAHRKSASRDNLPADTLIEQTYWRRQTHSRRVDRGKVQIRIPSRQNHFDFCVIPKTNCFPFADPIDEALPMEPTIRIITRGANGELRTKDYEKHESVLKMHTQIGVDDCSTDLKLRGLPVFRGLIGPMPESNDVVRYESPEVFETLTKQWGTTPPVRRRRRRRATS